MKGDYSGFEMLATFFGSGGATARRSSDRIVGARQNIVDRSALETLR